MTPMEDLQDPVPRTQASTVSRSSTSTNRRGRTARAAALHRRETARAVGECLTYEMSDSTRVNSTTCANYKTRVNFPRAARVSAETRTGSTSTSRTQARHQAHEPKVSLLGISQRPIGRNGARRIVEAGGRRDDRRCPRALRTGDAEAHPGEVRDAARVRSYISSDGPL